MITKTKAQRQAESRAAELDRPRREAEAAPARLKTMRMTTET